MRLLRNLCDIGLAALFLLSLFLASARASRLSLPPETPGILDKIYSFDLDGAVQASIQMQQQRPEHPLGYLLQNEALWWKIWCQAAEYIYGLTDARRRLKLEVDQL